MGRAFPRQSELTSIRYYPAHPGSRAVFLVEARTKKEVRQVRELFDMVGQLAEVVPISHGAVMSYAVQVQGDPSLFGKIEWLLKTQFTFSIVERNFSDVTFRLVHSLCEDSDTQMEELPACGICAAIDPFPTRATLDLKDEEDPLHLAYCARCAALHAEESEEDSIRTLLRKDRRRLRVAADVPVTRMPEIVEERPEWETGALAIAG
jgi:hypothetical protein